MCMVRSHPVRGAWIEMMVWEVLYPRLSSHPVRGAWVEMWIAQSLEVDEGRRTP